MGAVIGLGLAAFAALGSGKIARETLAPGAIASVNGNMILRADFARALTAVSVGRTNPLLPADEAGILARLIEEELLVQRALDRGFAQADSQLRNALVNAVTADVIARSQSRPVSEQDLQSYYQKNVGRFTVPARYSIRVLFFTGQGGGERMAEFDQTLADGENPSELVRIFGGKTLGVPRGLLSARKIIDYIGPVPATGLDDLHIGQWSRAIPDRRGVWRVYLEDRIEAKIPPLPEIAEQVRVAFTNERDDAALRHFLNAMKKDADINYSNEINP